MDNFADLRQQATALAERVPAFLRPLLFVVMPLVLLHPLWTAGTADSGSRERPVPAIEEKPKRPLALAIPRATVQEGVEQHESFSSPRRAVCPRRVLDRWEEESLYPAIGAMRKLKFISRTSDTSRGQYENIIELTHEGRFALLHDVQEEAEQYVIKLARRQYVPESEEYSPREGDEQVVVFGWRWEPLNALGKQLRTPACVERACRGRAIWKRNDGEWQLERLVLDDDGGRDLMQR